MAQKDPHSSIAVDVSTETPLEVSTLQSHSLSEVVHGKNDLGDCVNFTSPPRTPKMDLRAHNSPRKSLSRDSTTKNDEAGCQEDDGPKETGFVEDSDCLHQLSKSNSVVARVSMFAQLEEDMKRAAKEAKSKKLSKRSNRSAARREDLPQTGNRFATQPVTMGEVQEAVRSAINRDIDSALTGKSFRCFYFSCFKVLAGSTRLT